MKISDLFFDAILVEIHKVLAKFQRVFSIDLYPVRQQENLVENVRLDSGHNATKYRFNSVHAAKAKGHLIRAYLDTI